MNCCFDQFSFCRFNEPTLSREKRARSYFHSGPKVEKSSWKLFKSSLSLKSRLEWLLLLLLLMLILTDKNFAIFDSRISSFLRISVPWISVSPENFKTVVYHPDSTGSFPGSACSCPTLWQSAPVSAPGSTARTSWAVNDQVHKSTSKERGLGPALEVGDLNWGLFEVFTL